MINGAQALMESLKREGVERVFGYAGATICPAVDALAATDIAYTLVRTEQNAGHMASGYARMIGKPAVCMVTSGPVLIDIPIDIQQQMIDPVYPDSVDIRGYKPSVKGNDNQIKRVAASISAAQKPLLCMGGGLFSAKAQEELIPLCESARIPVVTTMMGLGLLPRNHRPNRRRLFPCWKSRRMRFIGLPRPSMQVLRWG